MLPSQHRLRDPQDFRLATRRGRRAGSASVVVHALEGAAPVRVGFVVSKGVGNAVVRNRVKRRLRALVAERLAHLDGSIVVVRAQPAAATSSSAQLGADLDRCLQRVCP
ncbi:ribonuclease P protein component [Nocardioides sp. TRM66260-LWL]|uniref:ribonuclease P protein component n=1 Tax=Nocardioides sp. TRM66260-LWL TaxID=2874478 RepID=UPI001CC3D7A5|nr:ribonuclease P protein component [Nocardioides sp. TRM66260-LWL]MBZ5735555.1 ribonuclease P protein component [Nocardioides sp. TRM66260-LWL]